MGHSLLQSRPSSPPLLLFIEIVVSVAEGVSGHSQSPPRSRTDIHPQECRHEAWGSSQEPSRPRGKQELERPTGSLQGSLVGPTSRTRAREWRADQLLSVVTIEVRPRVIPRLQPQNPMGAGDQIWTLHPPHPAGTVLGKGIITKIRAVAFRKTRDCVGGEWSSNPGRLLVGGSLEWRL